MEASRLFLSLLPHEVLQKYERLESFVPTILSWILFNNSPRTFRTFFVTFTAWSYCGKYEETMNLICDHPHSCRDFLIGAKSWGAIIVSPSSKMARVLLASLNDLNKQSLQHYVPSMECSLAWARRGQALCSVGMQTWPAVDLCSLFILALSSRCFMAMMRIICLVSLLWSKSSISESSEDNESSKRNSTLKESRLNSSWRGRLPWQQRTRRRSSSGEAEADRLGRGHGWMPEPNLHNASMAAAISQTSAVEEYC